MGWVVFGECMFDPEARELRRSERRVVVHKNTVLNPFSADVFVGNSENTPYRITRNHVEVSNLFAIGIQWGGDGSTVARNTIVGTGWLGIALYPDGSGNRILRNDVEGLEVDAPGARIHLDAATSHNLVVVKDAADVIDLGTDNRIIVRGH